MRKILCIGGGRWSKLKEIVREYQKNTRSQQRKCKKYKKQRCKGIVIPKTDLPGLTRPGRGENIYLEKEWRDLIYQSEELLWGDLSPETEIKLQNILKGKL